MIDSIKVTIIKIMSNPGNKNILKKTLLEWVAGVEGCNQKEAAKAFSELKKEGKVYCVDDMPGFVGIHLEGR